VTLKPALQSPVTWSFLKSGKMQICKYSRNYEEMRIYACPRIYLNNAITSHLQENMKESRLKYATNFVEDAERYIYLLKNMQQLSNQK
jgi:hypothetical protein